MLIINTELTMSHVGLGCLNEYSLLILFGNAHSQRLVSQTDLKPSHITDQHGRPLYPAYFMTHIKVPKENFLSCYSLWEKISVAINVSRFGETLLESDYILFREGESATENNWLNTSYPMMKGNNLLIVDVTHHDGDQRIVSPPKSDSISDLPKKNHVPDGIQRSKYIRSMGFDEEIGEVNIRNEIPISYYICHGRDTSPGHAMIFAKFTEIMNYAESVLFNQLLTPSLPLEVIQLFELLEREIFYYGNAFAGEQLHIYLAGNINPCNENYHGDQVDRISLAIIHLKIEIYKKDNQRLLAMAKVKKLIILPSSMQDLILDCKRIINKY